MIKKWTDINGLSHQGEIMCHKEGVDVIECSLCEFKHIVPFADESSTQLFYSEKFYSEEKDSYISNHEKDKDWWAIEHNEKYEYFEKHFDNSKRRKLIDIGSGPGFFLKVGKERGWDTLGVEPGVAAYKYSTTELELNVINTYFNRKTYGQYGKFDVVHLNNVLEHISNPIEILQLANQILLPGGLISITSPNDFNPLQIIAAKYLQKDLWWVSPDHHVNYFNSNSLINILKRTGFSKLFMTASFPLELFLLMGDDYVGNDNVGRAVHTKRMNMEKVFYQNEGSETKNDLYSSLSKSGLGREITIIGKKESLAELG
jgi:2-polyprenyl-3-methyl-5-hydroxy-6-metoxy-1,4-benzoquinol methylase